MESHHQQIRISPLRTYAGLALRKIVFAQPAKSLVSCTRMLRHVTAKAGRIFDHQGTKDTK